jgi:uncharacterized membrane protein YphA (DoxX/SURF4 family)
MGAKIVGHILAAIVSLAFLFAGATKLAAWHPNPDNFFRWGLPEWVMYVTGGLECLGAVLLLIPLTRVAGAGVLIVVMIGAVGVHLFNGEFTNIYAPVVLAVVAGTAGALQIQKLRQA